MNMLANPELEAKLSLLSGADYIEAFIIDVNGVPRGKWLQLSLIHI